MSVDQTKSPPDAARALWTVAPGRAELRPEPVPAPGPDEVAVRALWSGLSRGTERLMFDGRVPECEWERMRGPHMGGAFPYPVKYGYCAVGEITGGAPDLTGRLAFVLHPHQEAFVAQACMAAALPDGLPPRRAILSANMETALNVIWDSGASAGDRIAIVGAGAVGLLVAFLAARLPGAEVLVVDHATDRRPIAEGFGARFATPDAAQGEADVVIHTSATAAGLSTALALGGHQAAIVEASWHGDKDVPAPLGRAFHSRRLRLISSQVGGIPPLRAPRWTHARRLRKAMELLRDDRLDALITEEIAFADLPAAMPRLLGPDAPGLVTAIRY
ncbi:zinc-binding alcohol dehydrogenase [Terrarubrum flagellatum]|uniref:zinc-dependent alcohol dehydrogenase n=1 Tax=Terrirubrum flagellatum TaxID=2895980 RepID=UPI00314502BC